MQSVSSRIWTRAAVPIFYDDNHEIMGTWKRPITLCYGTQQKYIFIILRENISVFQNNGNTIRIIAILSNRIYNNLM